MDSGQMTPAHRGCPAKLAERLDNPSEGLPARPDNRARSDKTGRDVRIDKLNAFLSHGGHSKESSTVKFLSLRM